MKRGNAKQKHPDGTPEGRSLMHDQPFGPNALASVQVARLVLSTTPAVGRTFLIYRLICHQHSLCGRWRLRGVSTANGRILTINRNNWQDFCLGDQNRPDQAKKGLLPRIRVFRQCPFWIVDFNQIACIQSLVVHHDIYPALIFA